MESFDDKSGNLSSKLFELIDYLLIQAKLEFEHDSKEGREVLPPTRDILHENQPNQGTHDKPPRLFIEGFSSVPMNKLVSMLKKMNNISEHMLNRFL